MTVEELITALKGMDQSLEVKAKVKVNNEDLTVAVDDCNFDEDAMEVVLGTD